MLKFTKTAFLLLSLLFTLNTNAYSQNIADPLVNNMKSRVGDAYGSGQYGADRDKKMRTHKGLDIVVATGEKVYSPFKCDVIREAMPYKDDPSYRGLVLKGKGEWDGYEMKIFYVEGLFTGESQKGQLLGSAQNLKIKYPTITNHIHIEVKKYGVQIDPFEVWQMSF